MAAFAQLYLQRGRWGDRTVVPAGWVGTSTSQHVDFQRRRWYRYGTGYGYWR